MENEYRLSSDEKIVLKFLYNNRLGDINTLEISASRINAAAISLQTKRLIIAHFVDGGSVIDAKITSKGEAYLEINPEIKEPKVKLIGS